MAYKKKYVKKKKVYKKKAKMSFEKRVKNVIKKNSETKRLVKNSPASTIDDTGLIVDYTSIAEGTTISTREGQEIMATGLSYSGWIKNHTGATDGTMFRMSLVQDLQQLQDTAPSYANIYDNTDIMMGMNIENNKRFKVLHTKFLTINQAFSGQTKTIPVKGYIKLRDIRVKYNGVLAADIQKNGLYMCFITNQGAATAPSVDFKFKFYFKDL